MALTAANVITRATDILQDQNGVRWTAAEMLRWLNDGRRAICILRPDIYAITAVITMTAGSKQSIPADGTRFIDAIRNMNADGVTPLAAIRPVRREILDAQSPNWHVDTPATPKHFMFDERVPKIFFVWPPAPSNARLEIAYAQTPTEITNTATELTAEDMYTGALVDYLCYRCFSKDAEYAGNGARAAAHYQLFQTELGVGDARDMTTSPNTARMDGVPSKGGG